jgi:hypothetical protein
VETARATGLELRQGDYVQRKRMSSLMLAALAASAYTIYVRAAAFQSAAVADAVDDRRE